MLQNGQTPEAMSQALDKIKISDVIECQPQKNNSVNKKHAIYFWVTALENLLQKNLPQKVFDFQRQKKNSKFPFSERKKRFSDGLPQVVQAAQKILNFFTFYFFYLWVQQKYNIYIAYQYIYRKDICKTNPLVSLQICGSFQIPISYVGQRP